MHFCNYVIVSLVFLLPFTSSRIVLFIYKRQQDIRFLFRRQRVPFDENVEGWLFELFPFITLQEINTPPCFTLESFEQQASFRLQLRLIV